MLSYLKLDLMFEDCIHIYKSVLFRIKRKIWYLYKEIPHFIREYKFFKDKRVRLFNWYEINPNFWLCRFIIINNILRYNTENTISIFSVFGMRVNFYLDNSDFKIFYSGENVHAKEFSFSGKYTDNMIESNIVDLSIGFDYLSHDKYMRFPLWILYLFEPESSYKNIKEKCDILNNVSQIKRRDKFCALLSRMDRFGFRESLYQQLLDIGRIDCDGLFRHNNDELRNVYNDNKIEYLKNYQFNLCPENSNHPGYCTEKIFESIQAGCIPIYWGSDNNPEPNILNHDSIIFVDPFSENSNSIRLVKQLYENREFYLDFVNQPKLLPEAPDVIFSYFEMLKLKLVKLTATN